MLNLAEKILSKSNKSLEYANQAKDRFSVEMNQYAEALKESAITPNTNYSTILIGDVGKIKMVTQENHH